MLDLLKTFFAAAANVSNDSLGTSMFVFLVSVVVAAGLGCDVAVLRRFLPKHEFQVRPKPWGMQELALAVVALAVLFVFLSGLYTFIGWVLKRDRDEMALYIVPSELVVRLVLLVAFGVFFRSRHLRLREALGLKSETAAKAAGWGAVFGLAAVPLVGAVMLGIGLFCRALKLTLSKQAVVELFLKTDSTQLVVLLVLFAVVVAPVFEELCFRGFMYPALKQRFGMGRALLITAALFAVTHMHGPSLLPLFVLALGLALAYELTGSLLASITMHAVFNALMVLQVLYQRSLQ